MVHLASEAGEETFVQGLNEGKLVLSANPMEEHSYKIDHRGLGR